MTTDQDKAGGGARFARRRVISLEDATPELMEAEPDTTIGLTTEQAEQLQEIERAAGGRFRRGAGAPDRIPRVRPAGRA